MSRHNYFAPLSVHWDFESIVEEGENRDEGHASFEVAASPPLPRSSTRPKKVSSRILQPSFEALVSKVITEQFDPALGITGPFDVIGDGRCGASAVHLATGSNEDFPALLQSILPLLQRPAFRTDYLQQNAYISDPSNDASYATWMTYKQRFCDPSSDILADSKGWTSPDIMMALSEYYNRKIIVVQNVPNSHDKMIATAYHPIAIHQLGPNKSKKFSSQSEQLKGGTIKKALLSSVLPLLQQDSETILIIMINLHFKAFLRPAIMPVILPRETVTMPSVPATCVPWKCGLHTLTKDATCTSSWCTYVPQGQKTDKLTGLKAHLQRQHHFGPKESGLAPGEELHFETMVISLDLQACLTHQLLRRRNVTLKHTLANNAVMECNETTCRLVNFSPPVVVPPVLPQQQTWGMEDLFSGVSYKQLGTLLRASGPSTKRGHKNGLLILEKKCWIKLLNRLLMPRCKGEEDVTDTILKQMEIFKKIVHENIKNFLDKDAWAKEMQRRMELVLDDQWKELKAITLLQVMGHNYKAANKRPPPPLSDQEQQQALQLARHARAKCLLAVARIAKARDCYVHKDGALNTIVPDLQEKLDELFIPKKEAVDTTGFFHSFPEEPYHDVEGTDDCIAGPPEVSHNLPLAHLLHEVLTVSAFVTRVRRAPHYTAPGADGWHLDHLKSLFLVDNGGLHEQLAPLFVAYIKLVYLEQLPPAYIKHMVAQNLLLFLEKDKKHAKFEGNEIRPIQPASGLFKLVDGLLMKSQRDSANKLFGTLQLGIHQSAGSEIVVKRAQWAFDNNLVVICMDEKNAYGHIDKSLVGKDLAALPALQAIVQSRANVPNTLVNYNGDHLVENSFHLPQGGNLSGLTYATARLPILQTVQALLSPPTSLSLTLATGDLPVPRGAIVSFIDNFYIFSPTVSAAIKSFDFIETSMGQVSSLLNPKDTIMLVPFLHQQQDVELIQSRIQSSPSVLQDNVLFHPQQQGFGGSLPSRGCKIMGCPVGTVEYQTAFMAKKVDAMIQKAQILETIAASDFQHFLIFFLQCSWHQPIAYWGRLIHPDIMEPLAIKYQEALYTILEKQVGPLSPFHRKWLGRSSTSNGINMFDIPAFLQLEYVCGEIQFHRYLLAHPEEMSPPVIDDELFQQIEKFVHRIGGWEVLPEAWRLQETPSALYHVLLNMVLADEKLKLQEVLHQYIKQRDTVLCEELLSQQPNPVQQVYHITKEAGRDGTYPLTTLPVNQVTEYGSLQLRVLFRLHFGLPLPGLNGVSVSCPGKCAAHLDPYGAHLINCMNISTRKAPDTYNKQTLHSNVVSAFSKVVSGKHGNVQYDPTGTVNRPTLSDGTCGRLDMKYVVGETGRSVLVDVSIGNPLDADVFHGVCDKNKGSKCLNAIRTGKNNKYQNAIKTKLVDTDFKAVPFNIYGHMSTEAHDTIGEVSAYIHQRNTQIDTRILRKMYTRDLACSLHKAVAKLVIARLDLIRFASNEYQRMGDDIIVITNKVIAQGTFLNKDAH